MATRILRAILARIGLQSSRHLATAITTATLAPSASIMRWARYLPCQCLSKVGWKHARQSPPVRRKWWFAWLTSLPRDRALRPSLE
jgi:hypothetical protein